MSKTNILVELLAALGGLVVYTTFIVWLGNKFRRSRPQCDTVFSELKEEDRNNKEKIDHLYSKVGTDFQNLFGKVAESFTLLTQLKEESTEVKVKLDDAIARLYGKMETGITNLTDYKEKMSKFEGETCIRLDNIERKELKEG